MTADLPSAFGPYLLLKKLGEGGTGEVYLAVPAGAKVARPLVLKRLRAQVESDDIQIRRLRHEGAIAVSVESPYVVRVLDVGVVGSEPFITMDYVAGWPLSRVYRLLRESHTNLSIDVAIALIAGALRGIHSLHTAVHPRTLVPLGVVHRDVSPRNLILEPIARLKVIDFGLGKSNIQEWATRAGVLLGTPGYISPEQMAGGRVDHRADLYSLAVICFELLTLQAYAPRDDRAPGDLRRMGEFRPPSSIRPDIPKAIDDVLEKALAARPEGRFDSAAVMLDALTRALGKNVLDDPDPEELPKAFLLAVEAERVEIEELLPSSDLKERDPSEVRTEIFAKRSIGATEVNATLAERLRPFEDKTKILAGNRPRGRAQDTFISIDTLSTESGAGTAHDHTKTVTPESRVGSLRVLAALITVAAAVIAVAALISGIDPRSTEPGALIPPRGPNAASRTAEVSRSPARVSIVPRNAQTETPEDTLDAASKDPSREPTENPGDDLASRESKRSAPRGSPPPSKRTAKRDSDVLEPPAPLPVPEALDRFMRRAADAKRRHPSHAQAIDELISDATMWRSAGDSERARSELERLERNLSALLGRAPNPRAP